MKDIIQKTGWWKKFTIYTAIVIFTVTFIIDPYIKNLINQKKEPMALEIQTINSKIIKLRNDQNQFKKDLEKKLDKKEIDKINFFIESLNDAITELDNKHKNMHKDYIEINNQLIEIRTLLKTYLK